MREAVCRAYGSPDVVEIDDIPSPPVGPGQVRVRVSAASVNFPDVLLVANEYQLEVPTPFVPGSEFAGVVEELGDSVTTVAVGDRVVGAALVGAFAEEAVVSAAAVTPIPAGVDVRAAAAFGVAYKTGYHALRTVAKLRAGDELIVLGAGGGVGLATVDLGVALGASVTAVASTDEKLDVAKSYGATHLINHRAGKLREALREALPEGADVVVDPVGGDLAEPALRSLHWGGRFVTVGYASGVIPHIPLNLVLLKGVQVLGFQIIDLAANAPDFRQNETEVLQLLADGRIAPHIGAAFPLEETAAALQYVADGRAIGKVLLDVRS